MEDSSYENAQTEDPEEIFIDRNGQLFEFILEVFVTCTVSGAARGGGAAVVGAPPHTPER